MNYALSETIIKSNWFDEKKGKSIYKRIGKDKGLNLYIQLFKYRIHRVVYEDFRDYKYNDHVFRVSLYDLRESMKVNTTKYPTYEEVCTTLMACMDHGLIKFNPLHNKDNLQAALYDGKGKVRVDRMLELETKDIPKFERVHDKDEPATYDDYYVPVNFGMVDYIYENLKLTTGHVAVYIYIMKWSRLHGKAYKSIENMGKELGMGKRKVKNILLDLNREGIIYTARKQSGKGRSNYEFEHYPCEKIKYLEQFKRENADVIRLFLQYHQEEYTKGNKKETEDSFIQLDNEWGELRNSV